jgi:acetylornithine deacetylase/succinyl-diaminopimelate desuccinylase-like protein
MRAACRAGFGTDPVSVASGGSIAAVAMLRSAFNVPPLLLGFGPSDDGAHGADEYLDLRDWGCGVDTSVVFMEHLSRLLRTGGRPTLAGASQY